MVELCVFFNIIFLVYCIDILYNGRFSGGKEGGDVMFFFEVLLGTWKRMPMLYAGSIISIN